MGKTRYNTIKQLLKPIVGETIHMNKLWRRIVIEVGSDERTIRDYINTMISLGMIVEVEEKVREDGKGVIDGRIGMYKIISNEADI